MKKVLEYKRSVQKPIFDPQREAAVIEKNLKRLQDPAYQSYYRQFLINLMDLSKAYQQALLDEKH